MGFVGSRASTSQSGPLQRAPRGVRALERRLLAGFCSRTMPWPLRLVMLPRGAAPPPRLPAVPAAPPAVRRGHLSPPPLEGQPQRLPAAARGYKDSWNFGPWAPARPLCPAVRAEASLSSRVCSVRAGQTPTTPALPVRSPCQDPCGSSSRSPFVALPGRGGGPAVACSGAGGGLRRIDPQGRAGPLSSLEPRCVTVTKIKET